MEKNVDENVIYLSKEGYEKYLEEIDRMKEKLDNNGKQKESASGNNDDFALEDAKRDETKLMYELREKVAALPRIVVLDKIDDLKRADINDIININMCFMDEDVEEETFKLVGTANINPHAEIREVSINSPLGKVVYGQPEGFKGGYTVDGNNISVEIKKIAKSIDELENNIDTKRMG